MPARVSSPAFVGRAAELGRLEAALARAERGAAAAVFVGGESGVGKTRLLRELERLAVARGARVLRGDCLAFGADGMPYAPIAAALRGLARELEPAAFDELVGPTGGDLARLLPELNATHRPDEPGEGITGTGEALAQARLFGLLRALLDRLAAETPVLFAVEDLHWADRSTLEFLVVAGPRPARRAPAGRRHLSQRRAAPPPSAAPVPGRGGAPRGRRASRGRGLLAAELGEQVAGILAAPPSPAWSLASTRAARATPSSPRSCSPLRTRPRARCRRACATS